jgi:CTP synthase (UTP-ammonia lyase)
MKSTRHSPTQRMFVLGDRDEQKLAHREVDAALALFSEETEAHWIGTDSDAARDLDDADGVWLVPGGPYRDDTAAEGAIEYCLDSGTPFLGTCSGFQYACLAIVKRHGLEVVHAEVDPGASDPLIAPLVCRLEGVERLVVPVSGTRLASICGKEAFGGMHFCGYGLATEHESTVEAAGATISARADDVGVEAIELSDHPFFLATAFQPQVGAGSTGQLHPLLGAFVSALADAASRDAARLSDHFGR